MSNCIRLTRNKVTFTADDIDIAKVVDLMSCAKYPHPYPDINDKEGLRAMGAWWWFSKANVYVDPQGRYVTVNFGEGHSSHTWRDFGWLLNQIKDMMKRSVIHTFYIRDEYDGFRSIGPFTVNFKEGMPK